MSAEGYERPYALLRRLLATLTPGWAPERSAGVRRDAAATAALARLDRAAERAAASDRAWPEAVLAELDLLLAARTEAGYAHLLLDSGARFTPDGGREPAGRFLRDLRDRLLTRADAALERPAAGGTEPAPDDASVVAAGPAGPDGAVRTRWRRRRGAVKAGPATPPPRVVPPPELARLLERRPAPIPAANAGGAEQAAGNGAAAAAGAGTSAGSAESAESAAESAGSAESAESAAEGLTLTTRELVDAEALDPAAVAGALATVLAPDDPARAGCAPGLEQRYGLPPGTLTAFRDGLDAGGARWTELDGDPATVATAVLAALRSDGFDRAMTGLTRLYLDGTPPGDEVRARIAALLDDVLPHWVERYVDRVHALAQTVHDAPTWTAARRARSALEILTTTYRDTDAAAFADRETIARIDELLASPLARFGPAGPVPADPSGHPWWCTADEAGRDAQGAGGRAWRTGAERVRGLPPEPRWYPAWGSWQAWAEAGGPAAGDDAVDRAHATCPGADDPGDADESAADGPADGRDDGRDDGEDDGGEAGETAAPGGDRPGPDVVAELADRLLHAGAVAFGADFRAATATVVQQVLDGSGRVLWTGPRIPAGYEDGRLEPDDTGVVGRPRGTVVPVSVTVTGTYRGRHRLAWSAELLSRGPGRSRRDRGPVRGWASVVLDGDLRTSDHEPLARALQAWERELGAPIADVRSAVTPTLIGRYGWAPETFARHPPRPLALLAGVSRHLWEGELVPGLVGLGRAYAGTALDGPRGAPWEEDWIAALRYAGGEELVAAIRSLISGTRHLGVPAWQRICAARAGLQAIGDRLDDGRLTDLVPAGSVRALDAAMRTYGQPFGPLPYDRIPGDLHRREPWWRYPGGRPGSGALGLDDLTDLVRTDLDRDEKERETGATAGQLAAILHRCDRVRSGDRAGIGSRDAAGVCREIVDAWDTGAPLAAAVLRFFQALAIPDWPLPGAARRSG